MQRRIRMQLRVYGMQHQRIQLVVLLHLSEPLRVQSETDGMRLQEQKRLEPKLPVQHHGELHRESIVVATSPLVEVHLEQENQGNAISYRLISLNMYIDGI